MAAIPGRQLQMRIESGFIGVLWCRKMAFLGRRRRAAPVDALRTQVCPDRAHCSPKRRRRPLVAKLHRLPGSGGHRRDLTMP